MTKKHFILFAETIKAKFDLADPKSGGFAARLHSALEVIEIVETVALDSNPRFDSRRFRVACGALA